MFLLNPVSHNHMCTVFWLTNHSPPSIYIDQSQAGCLSSSPRASTASPSSSGSRWGCPPPSLASTAGSSTTARRRSRRPTPGWPTRTSRSSSSWTPSTSTRSPLFWRWVKVQWNRDISFESLTCTLNVFRSRFSNVTDWSPCSYLSVSYCPTTLRSWKFLSSIPNDKLKIFLLLFLSRVALSNWAERQQIELRLASTFWLCSNAFEYLFDVDIFSNRSTVRSSTS